MNRWKAIAIGRVIERELGVSLDAIRNPKARQEKYCIARAVFLAIMQTTAGFESQSAAIYLSRSRGTINYIRREHAKWLEVDSVYRETFERIRMMCQNSLPNLSEPELLSLKIQLENDVRRSRRQISAIETELRRRNVRQVK